jgi:hypothetical protein
MLVGLFFNSNGTLPFAKPVGTRKTDETSAALFNQSKQS